MNQNALFPFVLTRYFLFNLLDSLRPDFVFLYDLWQQVTRVAYAMKENCMQYPLFALSTSRDENKPILVKLYAIRV
jgi:hypothetical protein